MATVTISAPLCSTASRVSTKSLYLPVPTSSLDWYERPAITSASSIKQPVLLLTSTGGAKQPLQAPLNLKKLDVVFIFFQQTHRTLQCITTERIAQFPGTHDFQHAGLPLLHLHVNGAFERRTYVLQTVHDYTLRPHGFGNV